MYRVFTPFAAVAALALVTTSAGAQDKLKIGIVATLSGPPAVLGQQLRNGFQLAVKDLGGKLGGREVEIIVQDDELKPDIAVTKVKALIERDKVDFVVGPIFSNVLQAIFKPVTDAGIVLISPNAWSFWYEVTKKLALHSLPAKLEVPAFGLISTMPASVTGLKIACSTLEKIGPTTKSTLSRSISALTLVTAMSGLSSSSCTMISTSRPPSLPPRSFTASWKPLRSCWPSTAGGPESVGRTPVLSLSWAPALVVTS